MGTGYTRQDVSDNIADTKVADAADIDLELDAVESAFNSSTGHTHDGTTAEGGPITKLGPAQDLVVGTASVTPKTTNTLDLGSSGLRFKDLYLEGGITSNGAIDATLFNGAAASTYASVGNTMLPQFREKISCAGQEEIEFTTSADFTSTTILYTLTLIGCKPNGGAGITKNIGLSITTDGGTTWNAGTSPKAAFWPANPSLNTSAFSSRTFSSVGASSDGDAYLPLCFEDVSDSSFVSGEIKIFQETSTLELYLTWDLVAQGSTVSSNTNNPNSVTSPNGWHRIAGAGYMGSSSAINGLRLSGQPSGATKPTWDSGLVFFSSITDPTA